MDKIIMKEMSIQEAQKIGIDNWETWECEASVFDWEFEELEVCYFFEGNVVVTAENEEAHIKEGMLVSFPKGMKCTWNVSKKIRKAYTYNYVIE